MDRILSKPEQDYLEELALYRKIIDILMIISQNQHGIKTDGRGVRAVKIFTRQTLCALSLMKLLPMPAASKSIEDDLWDTISIASITRNIIEGYIALFYFGIEKVSEDEAELRFRLLQLHRNMELYSIRKDNMGEEELRQFVEGIASSKATIKNHAFLGQLSEEEKKRVLQFREMYKTKADFEDSLAACKDLRNIYRYLSNHVHPLPLTIERIDNERGRGTGSDPDVGITTVCLMLSRKYMAATIVDLADHFPTELAERFKGEADSIRFLVTKGFE